MLRIGFDIDGVLANFVRSYQKLFIRLTGEDRFLPGDIEDPPCWDWPTLRGYTEEQTALVWGAIKTDPAFWLNLEPTSDVGLLRLLIRQLERKHDVYYVTSRVGERAKRQSELWLFSQLRYPLSVGPEVWPTVLISSEKGECCHALKLDVYVDDNFDNVVDCLKKSVHTRTYLLEKRYNQNVQTSVPVEIQGRTVLRPIERIGSLGRLFDIESI